MIFQDYMYIQILFFILALLFIGREVWKTRSYPEKQDKTHLYIAQLVLIIGVIVRLYNLDYMDGANLDEAMAGYEAWCLGNFGIDSHMTSFPVYMKVWGSGMSALYIYMAAPFVKLFGLSEGVFRLPMSLLGSFAILFFYWVLRKTQKDTLLTTTMTCILAICPWHIMKSRYGLDAMVAPDLILIGVCFIILACYLTVNWQRWTAYIFGFGILALSAYGYAVSWVVLPVLVMALFIYLLKKKLITTKQIAGSIGVMLLIAWPLIYFAGVMYLGFGEVKVGAMTIPQLEFNRADDTGTFILSSNDILNEIKISIPVIAKLILLGTDGISNEIAIPYFGVFYNVISLPLLGYGIWYFFRSKDRSNSEDILFIMLASASVLLILIGASLVHWNLLWLPFSIFSGYGIYYFTKSFSPAKGLFLSTFSILFLLFLLAYFNAKTFKPGFTYYSHMIKQSVLFVRDKDFDKIYYPRDIVHSTVLFFDPVDPYTFAKTVKKTGESIQIADSYANVEFGLPEQIIPQKNTAYVVSNAMVGNINLEGFIVDRNAYYTILWNKD